MVQFVLMALATLCIAVTAFLAPAKRAHVADVVQSGAGVEQRLLIKFCYAQYRSQSDVTRCLGRGGT